MQIDRTVFDSVRHAVHVHLVAVAKADASELEVKYAKPVQRGRFTEALRYFRSAPGLQGSEMTEEKTIDVTVNVSDAEAYRVTFPSSTMGISFDHEAVVKDYTIIQKKRSHTPVEIVEYGLRVNVKSEQELAPSVVGLRTVIADALEANNTVKTIRQKHRFSAMSKDGIFRYDLTSVKQAVTKAPYGSDIARGKLITAPDSYEIEIEMVDPGDSPSEQQQFEAHVKQVSLKMLGASSVLLKVIEDVDHLIPESTKKAVLKEYGVLVGAIANDEEGKRLIEAQLGGGGAGGIGGVNGSLSSSPPFSTASALIPFVGPKPVTLMKANVLSPPLPGEVSVLKAYTVTEKADGERRMLFVDKDHRVFTIDDRLNVSFTGLTSKGPASTLLDGEFLPSRKVQTVDSSGTPAVTATQDGGGSNGAMNSTITMMSTMMGGGGAKRGTRVNQDGTTKKAARTKTTAAKAPPTPAISSTSFATTANANAAAVSSAASDATATAALFMCFDAYFVGGKDVRGLPLMDRRPDTPDRISVAEKIFADGFERKLPTDCECKVKKFYPVDSQPELFARANTIFRERDAGLFPYQIDGLVFTPALLAVGEEMPPTLTADGDIKKKRAEEQSEGDNDTSSHKTGGGGAGGRYMGGSWRSVFKWKPPEANTIDFLVKFHDNDMVTGSRPDNKNDVYRVVDLYVGRKMSTQPLSILDALTGRLSTGPGGAIFSTHGKRNGGLTYDAVKFQPDGESRPVHRAYLLMNDEGRIIIQESKEEITDSVIVEFSLRDPRSEEEVAFRWTPLRIRHDKTERYHANGKNIARSANDFYSAQQVWNTVHDPITEQMLRGEDLKSMRSEGRSLEMSSQQQYYKRGDKARADRASLPMLNFHNAWVKERFLLGSFSGNIASIFDIGSGEGGDIPKWRRMVGLQRVMGIDYDKHNIVNREHGAYSRLLRKAPPSAANPTIVFFPMDGGRPLGAEQIESMPDTEDVKVGRALWGLSEEPSHPQLRALYGFASRAFDLVSCQFTVHYFFRDLYTLRTFAANVSSVLRDGGFFIGTCLDGVSVDLALKSQSRRGVTGGAASSSPSNSNGNGDKGTSIQGIASDGTLMWHVQQMYDGRFTDSPVGERTGHTVRVFMESIGHAVDEYLVDFELLSIVMADAGLVPVTDVSRQELGLSSYSGGFEELYDMMREHAAQENEGDHRILSALTMNDSHKRYSFLNRWFVFQKVGKKE